MEHSAAERRKGLLSLHGAITLFGGTALFSQVISLSALDITIIRCFIAASVLGLFFQARRQSLRLDQLSDYGIAILLGILIGTHWVTYFAGMQYAGVAIGMIAFFTFPLMTVLLEPLLHKKLPHWQDLMAGLIGLFGLWLIADGKEHNPEILKGIFTGILSALLFTLRNLLHKYKFSRYNGPQAMFYQTLVAALVLVAWLSEDWQMAGSIDWGLLVLLGIFFTALPHALFATSLRYLSAKTVGLISCMQPVYGTLLAVLILHQVPGWRTVVGGILVVSAAIYETLHGHKR